MSIEQRDDKLSQMIRETIETEQKEEKDHDFFYYDNSYQEKIRWQNI